MTTNLINNHLPKSVATGKGNLDQELKNLQSTKLNLSPDMEDNETLEYIEVMP